jgi:hypothetical protein
MANEVLSCSQHDVGRPCADHRLAVPVSPSPIASRSPAFVSSRFTANRPRLTIPTNQSARPLSPPRTQQAARQPSTSLEYRRLLVRPCPGGPRQPVRRRRGYARPSWEIGACFLLPSAQREPRPQRARSRRLLIHRRGERQVAADSLACAAALTSHKEKSRR